MTRGIWLGLLVSTVLVSALVLGRRAVKPVALGAIGLATLAFFNATLRSRVLQVFDTSTTMYTQRFDLWRANWEMFKDYPLFGVGYEQNALLTAEYFARLGIQSDFISHAHNIYLQMLSTTGAVGFSAFMAASVWFLCAAWRLWKNAAEWQTRAFGIGATIALIAFHIAGLTESNFTDAEVNHFVVFLWANIAALSAKLRESNASSA